MNKLYYVRCSRRSQGERTHFLITAPSSTKAEQWCQMELGSDWKVLTTTLVCLTPDEINMEV